MSKGQRKTGAAYIRVSTGKQEELSPDSQKRLILDYAKNNGIVIPDEFIFIEHGISGRKADKRPNFQKMIALAKSGKFEVILLWKFSRFARNQEESIVYKSMLKKVGVDVISISEPLVDGPFGSLIERIIEWMDEFYSIRLSGDVTRGMTEKAMRGGYQCRPPLGYGIPYHNAGLEIIPKEAQIVQKIFDSYVNKHLSAYQIAKNLNTLEYKTRRNRNFEKRSVEYILDNPCYAGYVRWNRKENATNAIKPEEEWIIREGSQEAIISKELFKAAKERRNLESNDKRKRPSETYKHWLSGLLKCSACGRTLILSSHKNRYGKLYSSFQCYGYSKGKCLKSHSISTLKIEPVVLRAIKEALDSGTITYALRQAKRQRGKDKEFLIKKQLELTFTKEKRIRNAYIDGIDSLEEYKSNKRKLENERNKLLEELKSIGSPEKTDTEAAMLQNVRNVYDILISHADTAQKSTALKSIVEKIIFNPEEMNIEICYCYISEQTH